MANDFDEELKIEDFELKPIESSKSVGLGKYFKPAGLFLLSFAVGILLFFVIKVAFDNTEFRSLAANIQSAAAKTFQNVFGNSGSEEKLLEVIRINKHL